MLNLVISATENLVVELFNDGKNISEKYEIQSNQSEDILKIIKAKLGKTSIQDVENILLNVGPGSFTGIRASMALVFGLSRTGKQKIVPFTTFDMFEYNKLSSDQIRVCTGFSNFVYAAYEADGKPHMECVTIDEVEGMARANQQTLIVVGNKLAEKFNGAGVDVLQAELSAKNVIEKFLSGTLEKRNVEPVYLRASQAEIQREEKLKNGTAKR